MTTEQREAIDRLNKDKNKPLACGDITIVNISDLDTVLSIIKEQDKEIERIEYIRKSFDYVVQEETKKKDKIIDLLIDKLNQNYAKVFKNNEVKEIIEIYEKIKNTNNLSVLEMEKNRKD